MSVALTVRGKPFKPLKTQPIRDFMAATNGGRPSEYHPTMDEMAKRFCLLGCTDEQLGRSFNVDEATVKRWMTEYSSFRASIKSGREEADANMAASLYHRGLGYSHKAEKITVLKVGDEVVEHRSEYIERYPPDTASAIFWLKNRRRDLWRDAPPSVVVNNNTLNVSADAVAAIQDYKMIVDARDE